MAAPKVELRPLAPADKDRLLVWRNSPDVAPYMYSDHAITAEEHERWFAGIEGDPRRAFWIVEMDGQPVGLANLYDIDPAERAASWAYYLADPLVRGKGAGAVMGWLVIEQAFGPFGLERLSCVVLESNLASRRLCLSLGFASGGPAPLQQGKAGWTFSLSRKAWLETRETQRQRLAAKGFALS